MRYKSLQSFSGFLSVGVKYFTRSNGINQLTSWSGVLPNNNNNNNNNNNIYLLQLVCYPVAVVILHVNKHEIGYY